MPDHTYGKRVTRTLPIAAALAVSGLIQAQAQDPERAKVERADAALMDSLGARITDPTVFVKSAALGGMAEIELAKLAQAKSQTANIRGFAARMLKDYDAIHRGLATVAKRKRLDVPTSLVYEDEQVLNEASEKSGAEFDAWYARRMITENQKAIALFQSAANMPDAELASFAKGTLPTLEEHQRLALAL
ncbi:MAG: DUF4142 domain-containing protein [Gammaproteobacteria bacterium]